MKVFDWNEQKNAELKQSRNVSFEDVVLHITNGDIIDIVEHHNSDKYPNQQMFVLNINDYVYYVPFVEDEQKVFLKTVIPSRKLTRKYLK